MELPFKWLFRMWRKRLLNSSALPFTSSYAFFIWCWEPIYLKFSVCFVAPGFGSSDRFKPVFSDCAVSSYMPNAKNPKTRVSTHCSSLLLCIYHAREGFLAYILKSSVYIYTLFSSSPFVSWYPYPQVLGFMD